MRFIVCELVKACGVLLISTVVIGGCGDPADPAENDGNQTNANQVNANDSPEPELSLEATPEEVTSETKAVFEFDANVDDPVFDCRIDSGDWESCDSPQTYEELDDGDRLFEVQLLDDGGEPLDASASFEWTVDTVAPETTLTEVPEDPASETTAHFEFEADDPDATFECRHDASWDECSSPHELSDLEPGEHHFQVRATDSVGNTEESAAEYTWEIVVATDWAEFSTGKRHVCGVTQEGALYCWGSNETHQLGISQEGFGEQNVPFPQPVGDDEDWAHISAGAEHSCGIRQDGSLWCWGSREYGALGDGQAEDESTPEPQLISDE